MERECCEFICGAPTTFKGYGIEQNRMIFFERHSVFCMVVHVTSFLKFRQNFPAPLMIEQSLSHRSEKLKNVTKIY